MERNNIIDNIRGIAFIFMIIQHLFYFYDVSNDYETKLSENIIINNAGVIARTMFILLAGYSLNMAYNNDKEKYMSKRIKKSTEILIHGFIITFVTYILYPKYFVRFGILHFLALGTLLISPLAPHKMLSIIILIISLYITIPKVHPLFDLITGASRNYQMMDWFPLQTWTPILLCGLIIGQHVNINTIQNSFLQSENILTGIGKNSLNLYTIHLITLLLFYKIYNYKKN